MAAVGIQAVGDVLTSAVAAAALVEPGERVLACGGAGVVEAITARGATVVAGDDPSGEHVDAVMVGLHRQFDYERMRIAATAVRRGARFIATNMDATFPTPDGPIPGAGAIVAAVATVAERSPVIAGKPHPPMAAAVETLLGGIPSERLLVVGDRLDTDGAFAITLGCPFALVRSGVTAPESRSTCAARRGRTGPCNRRPIDSQPGWVACADGQEHVATPPRRGGPVHRDVQEAGRVNGEEARQGGRGEAFGGGGDRSEPARTRQGDRYQPRRVRAGRGVQAGELARQPRRRPRGPARGARDQVRAGRLWPGEEGARQEGSRQEGAGQEGAGQEGAGEEGSRHEAGGSEEGAGQEGSRHEAGAGQASAGEEEGGGPEGAGQEGSPPRQLRAECLPAGGSTPSSSGAASSPAERTLTRR